MQYKRVFIPGATYFFTFNLQNRKSKLLLEDINKLRFAFRKTMHYYPFFINAVCILPDHIHMLIRLPENDDNYSLRLNMIKGIFSKQIQHNEKISVAKHKRRERGIWQNRFWEHLIRDELDYEHHINYIHYNPVKHGYVLKPIDWKYSSIHRFVREGLIPEDWAFCERGSLFGFGE